MMRRIYRFYLQSLFYVAVVLFGLGSLFYNGVCLIVYYLPGHQKLLRFHHTAQAALLQFFLWLIDHCNLCKITHFSRETPGLTEPSVIIANHTGLMDAIILSLFFPNAACVYKSKLDRNVGFSHILRLGGHLRNDEGVDLIRKGASVLREGRPVIVFPEGTRNQESDDISFKKGFALMAARAEVPVTLFVIHNPAHAFSREMSIRAPQLPFHLSFQYLGQKKIQAGESIDRFVSRVEETYEKVFSE